VQDLHTVRYAPGGKLRKSIVREAGVLIPVPALLCSDSDIYVCLVHCTGAYWNSRVG